MALAASLAAALAGGVPLGSTLLYVVGVAWGVLLPGLIVVRLCRGTAVGLLEDLTSGFLTGIAVQLIAWAAFVRSGIGGLLPAYPLIVVVPALVLPGPRGRLLRWPAGSDDRAQPWWGAWSLTAGYGLALVLLVSRTFAVNPLPPSRVRWYPDLYWHVAVAAQARTSVPPNVPQVSGQTLKYHWFSHAHMAADSLGSGVDVLLVASRLWYLPVYAAILALSYLLATRLAGTATAGVVTVVLLLVSAGLTPLGWYGSVGTQTLIPFSPSEILGVPTLLMATWWLIDLVRGARPTRGGWVLLTLSLLVCTGSKSSDLPVLLCGLLLVGAVQLLRRRWEGTVAAATGLTVLCVAVTAPFLAGGAAVSTYTFFALARTQLTVLFGEDQPEHRVFWALLGVVSLLILLQLVGVLLSLPMRRDPAVVLLAGTIVAGYSATLLVYHPSQSELYFLAGVVPLVHVLTAWGLVRVVGRVTRPARWIAAGLGGAAVVLIARAVTGSAKPAATPALRSMLVVAGTIVLVLAVGALIWRGGPRHRALVAAALVGAIALPSGWSVAKAMPSYDGIRKPENLLHPGAVSAATWLRTHTPERTLVATNVHCRNIPTRRICDSRALWVSALSGRQAYVESWGYTDQAYATAKHPRPGEEGVFYWSASFYDPYRLKVNDAAFNGPTPFVLHYLYARGVRYLIGDSRASTVSPKLDTMAQRVFHDGTVTVYRMRPS